MEADRVREIQSALIREKYLPGEPTGQWDQDSQAAMQKYQSDNGWQTKITPDSRALIKLGLGPNHTAAPDAAQTQPVPDTTPAAAPAPSPVSKGNTLAEAHSISN